MNTTRPSEKLSDRHLADLIATYTDAARDPRNVREYTLACALVELQELRAQVATR
jgi:hypothetical protein